MIKEIEKAVRELRSAILTASTERAALDLCNTINLLRDLAIAETRCFAQKEQNAASLKRAINAIDIASNMVDAKLE